MKLAIRAKPDSGKEYITKLDDDHYEVAVKAPPIKGMANRAIIQALADHFNTSPSNVTILSGHTSRTKVIEVVTQ